MYVITTCIHTHQHKYTYMSHHTRKMFIARQTSASIQQCPIWVCFFFWAFFFVLKTTACVHHTSVYIKWGSSPIFCFWLFALCCWYCSIYHIRLVVCSFMCEERGRFRSVWVSQREHTHWSKPHWHTDLNHTEISVCESRRGSTHTNDKVMTWSLVCVLPVRDSAETLLSRSETQKRLFWLRRDFSDSEETFLTQKRLFWLRRDSSDSEGTLLLPVRDSEETLLTHTDLMTSSFVCVFPLRDSHWSKPPPFIMTWSSHVDQCVWVSQREHSRMIKSWLYHSCVCYRSESQKRLSWLTLISWRDHLCVCCRSRTWSFVCVLLVLYYILYVFGEILFGGLDQCVPLLWLCVACLIWYIICV